MEIPTESIDGLKFGLEFLKNATALRVSHRVEQRNEYSE
jgi:hypothetical protein